MDCQTTLVVLFGSLSYFLIFLQNPMEEQSNLKKVKAKVFNSNYEGILKQWKNERKSIVFTNGCFDIIHLGHIDYLSKAADLGDKLVIGLNTDDSTRRLKGEQRPVNSEESRSLFLASFQFIDMVVFLMRIRHFS